MTECVFQATSRSRLSSRILLSILLTTACAALAQAQESGVSPREDLAGREIEAPHPAEQNHASKLSQAYRWALVGLDYDSAADFNKAEHYYSVSLGVLEKDPTAVSMEASVLDRLAHLYLVYGRLPEALNCRRKELALRRKLGDPAGIAHSQTQLGEVALNAGKFREAVKDVSLAYKTMTTPGGSDKEGTVSALLVLSYAHCARRDFPQGLTEAQRAFELSREVFAPDSLQAGSVLIALGFAQLQNKTFGEAEDTMRQGVAVYGKTLAPADPRMIRALQLYRDILLAQHKKVEAERLDGQLEAANRQSHGTCPGCPVSVYGLRNEAP